MSLVPDHVDEAFEFTNNWDLDNLITGNLTAVVERVHLCALRNEFNEGDEAGEPPTNHWTMCLQLTWQSAVMLDMVPGYGSDGLRGKIEASSLRQPYTEETLNALSFKPAKPITIGDVMQLIIENGRDAFNFSPEWEGCRFWMSVVVSDLEDGGLIQEGSARAAREALLKYWRNPEGSEPRMMREGTFRDR
ncbi:hypothetical protein NKR23_g7729 [Pleurostoma richardsiae]|uniref:DUF7770 domain-containing protein n=1 Tax=Pleurostoma richardsiae TaxID=41990 RepID=A0AA38VME1_9PEZI|nr:hypothetical protein NKR23_g7729 [Pleurostoma richardsiae]